MCNQISDIFGYGFPQVFIINDTMQEPTEQFRLKLGKVFSTNLGGGKLGGRNSTLIKIEDDDRKLMIRNFRVLFT